MYSNIGKKIKTVAQVGAWIGIIASFIFGIALIKSSFLLGIVSIAACSFASWIASLTLYGFGHLIENTDKLVRNTDYDCEPTTTYQNYSTTTENKTNNFFKRES